MDINESSSESREGISKDLTSLIEEKLTPILSKEDLEREELELKVKKLDAECKNIDYQISKKYRRLETLKAVASLGGIIAVFLSFITIVSSVYQWN